MSTQQAETDNGIILSGAIREAQDKGELIFIAAITYRPKEDVMQFNFPGSITEEEAIAMLKKHRCFPK